MHFCMEAVKGREGSVKVGIIGAMDVEVAALRDAMKGTKTIEKAGMSFSEGRIGETECVVVKSGIGKVNAGMCVQILADEFHASCIINTGVAGSLNNDINIGDIVVSKDACYHDVDATIFGYAPGEVPQLKRLYFEADEALRQQAAEACRQAAPEIGVFEGRVASGDQFISNKEKKKWLRATFEADCCEMEGAAIAQAATLNRIPFVIIRAISDKADESVTESYDVFEAKAAEHCANLVKHMLTAAE